MLDKDRPEWQLPDGVSRGTWDYFGLKSIATDYDSYFRDHPLLELDVAWVKERIAHLQHPSPPEPSSSAPPSSPLVIADLGCGTARALAAVAVPEAQLLAIDMSQHMLLEAKAKLSQLPNPYACVRMNLVHLEGLQDQSIDVAICLFSSFGMIRGRKYRQRMLSEVHRVLKPNGIFLVHVHNIWSSLRDPGGKLWLTRSYLRSLFDKKWEWGDRIYAYRGLPTMFLHSFSLTELRRDFRFAQLKLAEIRYLDIRSAEYLPNPSRFGNLRAGGFFIEAHRHLA